MNYYNRKAVIKKKFWIYRHPRLFIGVTSIIALLSFMSKPIYDSIFFDRDLVDLEQLLQEKHREKFTGKEDKWKP